MTESSGRENGGRVPEIFLIISDGSVCAEYEEEGFRKRTRPVLVPPSEYGVQCPSVGEVQPCQNPQCYVWDYDQWGSCMLDDPGEKCGAGQRNRQVYCTTHEKVSRGRGHRKWVKVGLSQTICNRV